MAYFLKAFVSLLLLDSALKKKKSHTEIAVKSSVMQRKQNKTTIHIAYNNQF